jgi:predicted porin
VPSRYDSDFAYISPRFSGVQFEAHYSIAGSAVEDTGNQAVYQLGVDWEGGPFRLGYADGWSVASYYDIWKDTILYVVMDSLSNDANAGFRPSGSAGLTKTFTAPGDVNGQTIRGVHVGFVYRF